MSLKELLGNLEVDFELLGGKITLKPLTLSDISGLLDRHRDELKALFNASKGVKEILAEMPELAYTVIAMSSGEDTEDIKKLPIGTQLEILEKVVDLSQISSDAMGKLVSRLIRGIQTVMPMTNLTSMGGRKPSKEQLEKSREQAIAS